MVQRSAADRMPEMPRGRRSEAEGDEQVGLTGVFLRVVIVVYLVFLVWMELDAWWMEEAANAAAKTQATGWEEVSIEEEL